MVTRGYRGLVGVTGSYRVFKGAIESYKGLQGDTEGYKGLQEIQGVTRVTGGNTELRGVKGH